MWLSRVDRGHWWIRRRALFNTTSSRADCSTGSGPPAQAARSTAATTTLSFTSRTRTLRLTRAGQERCYRRRPSGSSRLVAGSTASQSLGQWSLSGRQGDGEYLARRVPLAEPEARRVRGNSPVGTFPRTVTGSTTSPATSGNGRVTGSLPATPRMCSTPVAGPATPARPATKAPTQRRVNPARISRTRSSRAARIFAPPTTACAIAQLRDSRR